MRQRQKQQGTDGLEEIRAVGATTAREEAVRSVDYVRERFGVEEITRLAREKMKGGEAATAASMVSELRQVTVESLQLFKRRGYSVDAIGRAYEESVGDASFRGGDISPDSIPDDFVDTVIGSTDTAWGSLRESVGLQAQANALRNHVKPDGRKSPEAALLEEMRRVWSDSAKESVLGGRIEELRSGIGLRTLAALEERYRGLDSRGHEDAMPKAYMWAERAYWLTKHSIDNLRHHTRYSGEWNSLSGLGSAYEEALGDRGLASAGAGEVSIEAQGWDVIRLTVEQTAKAWERIKGLIEKR